MTHESTLRHGPTAPEAADRMRAAFTGRAPSVVATRAIDLPIKEVHYRAIAWGLKRAEIRRIKDVTFAPGDLLRLHNQEFPSLPPLHCKVTHVTLGTEDNGVMPGYAVLSFELIGA